MALGSVGSMAVALLGDMKDFDRKMDGATKRVNTFSSSVKKMGTAVTKYAKMAALAATAAVVAFGVSAVKTFVEFDTGMREVFTLMPKLSDMAKREMTEDVKALSKEIAILPTKVVPALYQAISAGIPKENVFAFMEIAGKAAIGGVTELEVAVDGLTTATNAYGLEVLTAQEAADIMFTAVKFGKTTFEELSARMFQAVPVAAKIGLEFKNVAAAAAQITLSGVPMRVAMTQIRSLLNEVAFEGKELNRVFVEAAGMSFPAYIEAGGDIAGIIEILEGAAEKAGISVAELTANLEAQGAMLNLSGIALDSLRNILEEMADSTGAAEAAYEEMAAGVRFQLDQLKVWWQTLKLDIGEDLVESLKDLLYWLEENQEGIERATKAIFDGLIAGLEWLQRNAGAIKAALITMAVGFAAIRFAVEPLSASIGLLTGGIALFILGVEGSAEAMLDASVIAAIWGETLDEVTEEASELDLALAALSLSVRTIPGLMIDAEISIDNYIAAITKAAGELWKVEELSAETFHLIVDGLEAISTEMESIPVEERMLRVQVAITNLLNTLAKNDKAVGRLRDAWLGLSETVDIGGGVISESAEDTADRVVEATAKIGFGLIEMTDAQKAAWDLHQAWLEAFGEDVDEEADDIVAAYEQMWENIKSEAETALVDMVNDFASYGSTREDEEETHQENLQRIRDEYADGSQEALETALGMAESEYETHRTTVAGVLRDMFGDFTTFLADELLALAAAEAVKSVAAFIALNPIAGTAHAAAGARYLVGWGAMSVMASSIPGYEEGGVVPGPIGAPQLAIVHGGEPIGAAGFEEVLDYERLGEAVAAGMGDVMEEFMGDGRPIIVQLADGTRIAQALYNPFQEEGARRGAS